MMAGGGELATFLGVLFRGDDGITELRALPSRARRFVPLNDVERVTAFLTQHAHENVYTGVASRRDASSGAGTNCFELWTAFVDVDFKQTPRATLEAQLAAFPFPPTLSVASGGGRHLYWALREPFTLPADGADATALLQRLAEHFGGDRASAEIARVLRVPTSCNHKPEYGTPQRVSLDIADASRVYDASELRDWLPTRVTSIKGVGAPKKNGAGAHPITQRQAAEQMAAATSSLIVRAPGPLAVSPIIGDGQRNRELYRLARSFHAQGLTAATVSAAIESVNRTQCLPPLPEAEVATLITHALTQPDRETFQPTRPPGTPGFDQAHLTDVVAVVEEGRQLDANGVPYVVEGLVPAMGSVGMFVAYAKVGKTTFTLTLGGAVAADAPFLDRPTRQVRVLVIAAEDPPSYTAYLARHLVAVPTGQMTFYRAPIRLDEGTLTAVAEMVQAGNYGLVLISSWQAVVAGLTKDENDNATAVRIMETVKVTARASGVPWLIDAHSGKGEDQGDDADPTRAMRGASGAAGAADYLLSLRYDVGGPFTTRRRLSGKGRFVSCPPMLLEYDAEAGLYTVLSANKNTMLETTWRLIVETEALTTTPQTATAIAQAAGLLKAGEKATTSARRRVQDALRRRPNVRTITETRGGHLRTLYASQNSEGAPNPLVAHDTG